MADELLGKYRKQHGGAYPEKISQVLWYGETNRHQGALESMAFWLLGVEPKWNGRNIVDGFRLVPESELGRPRVDVIFTISGIYRDGMADKVLLLDKAVRLAASAGDNAISRHDREAQKALTQGGTDPQVAAQIAKARVFGTKPGNYGVGVSKIVEQSKDADGHADDVGNLYIHYMNYAFSSEVWGGTAPAGLRSHLKGNQAVVFSRSTNLYGTLDNDDTYQYFGGLNAATKAVNRTAPDMYINNLRKQGAESMTDLKTWLATELNSRDWNPKWLKEMQRAGYAGARAMFKEMEHLYGFQATSAEQMDGSFWQNSYDVLLKDKHGLGMEEFFEKNNPHAQQWILSRMLEVDRQGSYRFSDEDRAELVRRYVKSVNRHGVTCSANTCGNVKVHQFVAAQAPLVSGLGNLEMRQFGQALSRATRWTTAQFRSAPAAMQAGLRAGARPRGGDPAPAPRPLVQQPAPSPPNVTGYRMQENVMRTLNPALGAYNSPRANGWTMTCLMGLVLAGVAWEFRRRHA
jgi:cobaltochelatase CobN